MHFMKSFANGYPRTNLAWKSTQTSGPCFDGTRSAAYWFELEVGHVHEEQFPLVANPRGVYH